MTIEREDVDRGRVDFSDVVSGRRLAPVHHGQVLRDEFLTPMALKVSRRRLNDLDVAGRTLRDRIEREVEPHAA